MSYIYHMYKNNNIKIKKKKQNKLHLVDDGELQKKIAIATEGFGNLKVPERSLSDRSRLSKENALTICDYIIAMKTEINPRQTYIKYTIQFLSELPKVAGIAVEKRFEDFTKDDILQYLDQCRKPEEKDPMHKWIGTYNIRQVVISRFFKWLYYPNVTNPKERNELSALEKKPDCIQGIRHLPRRETSCYKPSDLWTPKDDALFLKYVTNPRDRCYHSMSRDTSCRPHELLNLKIKDISDKETDNGEKYAEILVNGKTGSRNIPLIDSYPNYKTWYDNHPSRNNPNMPLFVSLTKQSNGRKQLTTSGLELVYRYYQKDFFPKLLKEPTTPDEDKKQISELLKKPWNPYVRRHTALTEKSRKLKAHVLNQHSGWSINSNMAQKYLHYFGNESSNDLLEAYGMKVGNTKEDTTLRPKICSNCQEPNPIDAKFCTKCRFTMSYEAYQEALETAKQKADELKSMKEQFNIMQSQIQELQNTLLYSLDKYTNLALHAKESYVKKDELRKQGNAMKWFRQELINDKLIDPETWQQYEKKKEKLASRTLTEEQMKKGKQVIQQMRRRLTLIDNSNITPEQKQQASQRVIDDSRKLYHNKINS